MKIVLIAIGVLLGALVLFLIWRYRAFMRATRRLENDVMGRIAPLTQSIQAGQEPDPELVRSLAAAPKTRNHAYGMLVYLQREDLFPDEYRTPEAIAESDLVYWLCHPNELGCAPDDIELMDRQYVDTGVKPPRVLYFVFRFRMDEPHWAAKDGWMAGVAGPYRERKGQITEFAPGTFSRFEPFDSKEPKDHIEFIHQLMLKRNGYDQLRGA